MKKPKRCWPWFHKWAYWNRTRFVFTSTQIRICQKCGKREQLNFYCGDLFSKEEF